jgi:hypothetical protein
MPTRFTGSMIGTHMSDSNSDGAVARKPVTMGHS